MIQETLQFFADEINQYLSRKLGNSLEARLLIGNVARLFDNDGGTQSELSEKAAMTLVNVEEDRISKQHENYAKTLNSVVYKQPPLYINLYVLFSVNKSTYTDALQLLTLILQFFQHRNVFTPDQYPRLDPKIQKLTVELHTLNFEQINHLWSTLGGKYLPSAVYKIRQLTIDEQEITGEGGLIKSIDISGQHKNAST